MYKTITNMRRLFFCLMAMMVVLTLSAQSVCENEVINNIMTRTSIRQYTNEPVSKADIETMLRAGMAAPTAVNKQPWHFVAVTNKEISKLVWLLLFVAIWTRRCRARHRSIGFRTARQPQKISSLQLKPLALVPYGQAAILWTTA